MNDCDIFREEPAIRYLNLSYALWEPDLGTLNEPVEVAPTGGVDDLLDPDKTYFDVWVWLQLGHWDPQFWHSWRMNAKGSVPYFN